MVVHQTLVSDPFCPSTPLLSNRKNIKQCSIALIFVSFCLIILALCTITDFVSTRKVLFPYGLTKDQDAPIFSALENVPPGEVLPYKQSAFRSTALRPTMKPPLDTRIYDSWRIEAANSGEKGDGLAYGKQYGDHGLFGELENANSQNLKNGWQLATFRKQLATAGIPQNITNKLERLGLLSLSDLDSVDTDIAVDESAPAWEDELPAFVLGAGGSNFVADHLQDSSLPQPQVILAASTSFHQPIARSHLNE